MAVRIQPVLMSGGSGTRLWPLSRKHRPKQFTALLGERTLFQETALRVAGQTDGLEFAPPIVVGAASHAALIREQLAAVGVSGARILLEPAPRNTAPCAAAAAAMVAGDSPDTLILLLPCDHAVTRPDAFRAVLRRGAPAARAGRIVTFGIEPAGPETAYGYIKAGAPLEEVFAVARFAEKPDRARAEGYLAEGGWTWNAGIFLFRAGTLLEEMQRHAPDILTSANQALSAGRESGNALLLDEAAFSACRSESIDYAVMEKTETAAVAPADIGWSDVGLWSAVWELTEKNGAGLSVSGDVTTVDSRDCLAMTDGPPIVLAGVENLVVVVKDGAVMVTQRDASASLKAVVEALKSQGRDELL